jgi:hypothetical protein
MTAACPWLREAEDSPIALRPVVARQSSGALRARGSREPAAIIGSDLRSDARRAFYHELPLVHPALDLRQIEASTSDSNDDFFVGRSLHGLIGVWLDAVEKLQSTEQSPGFVEPSAVLNALREVESDEAREAPDSLIYRIARDDHGRLAGLCADPRVMLRRERQLCPLGRVRELDAACMRWLDMQPGRTIAEKAGQKQQIRSIVRVRSAATLENRELRDLILRAQGAADGYCRANSRFQRSTRVASVRRFKREIESAYQSSVIATVPALSGVPTPNYVLQNSVKYKYVWKKWLELLRKQQLTQSLLHWGGRWLSELALPGVLDALESWEGAGARLQHRLKWRSEPHQGEFFEAASPIGAYIGRREEAIWRIDVARSAQLARGNRPREWERWAQLLPDFAIVPTGVGLRPLLFWSAVICDSVQQSASDAMYAELSNRLRTANAAGIVFQFGAVHSGSSSAHLRVVTVRRATDGPRLAGDAVREFLRSGGGGW